MGGGGGLFNAERGVAAVVGRGRDGRARFNILLPAESWLIKPNLMVEEQLWSKRMGQALRMILCRWMCICTHGRQGG